MSVFKKAKHAAPGLPQVDERYTGYTAVEAAEVAFPVGFDAQAYVDRTATDGVEAVYAKAREQAQLRAEENYNLVESPDHYRFPGGAQVIDITKHLGFLEGNIIKYVARAGRKGDRKEDLLKAKKYLEWALEEAS